MSNCYSSQAEYDDHDFIEGICKDCGEVSKRDVTALAGQVKMLESKVTELVERNRKLANQIVGHGDRMQETIGGIILDAKVEALREAVSDFQHSVGVGEFDEQTRRDGNRHAHIDEAWEYQGPYMDWLLNRADNLEAS